MTIFLRAIFFAALLSAPTLAQFRRPFLMSTTGSIANPGQTPLYQQNPAFFPLSAINEDVDVVTVFPEHLGFPVDLFLASPTPSPTHPWTLEIQKLANAAKATGKPIALQLALSRDYMVSKAYAENGALKLDRTWAPRCYDLSSPLGQYISNAYLNMLRWLSTLFQPKYVVTMAEINSFYTLCGRESSGWTAMVAVAQAAYDAVKATLPSAIVFPTFQLEQLYSNSLHGFDAPQYNALAVLKRDRFGVSTYPAGVAPNPYLLPADYLTRTKVRFPQEKRIYIAETGWNTVNIAVTVNNSCIPNLTYTTETFAADYLRFLLYYAYVENFEMVTWWSDRDLIERAPMTTCYGALPRQAPSCSGDAWCLAMADYQADYAAFWTPTEAEFIFKVFGSMGLRTYSGTPKLEPMFWWKTFQTMPLL
ncbi:MAG: hypothetical protein NW208_00915 [Bryobacter sp.]|nr:hypothetical protein [Bryobacter sp.]